MRFQGTIASFDSNALLYEHHIPIPDEVYTSMLKLAPGKRVKCIFEKGFIHYAAILPSKNSYYYILRKKDITLKMKFLLL